MVHASRSDVPRPGPDRIARRLMESARQDPSLVGRARPMPVTEPEGHSSGLPAFSQPSLPLRLLDHGALDLYRQCEQLVVIAVDAAQRAEETFYRAREALKATRRRSLLGGALGVLGVVAGLAAIADNHWYVGAAAGQIASTAPAVPTSPSTVAMAPATMEASAAGAAEQQASAPPAAPTSSSTMAEASATPDAPLTPPLETPLPALHATYVPSLPVPPPVAAPHPDVVRPPESPTATYVPAAPWPSPHRTGFSHATVRRPVVVMPPFVVTWRRTVAMLVGG